MKHQVNEMKHSFLETIKEESENRRTKFYNASLAGIFRNGHGNRTVQNSSADILIPHDSPQLEHGSVKSEQTLNASPYKQGSFLPLLP